MDKDLSRRDLLRDAGAIGAGAAVAATPAAALAAGRGGRGKRRPKPKTPKAALQLLQGGNKRFRAGKLELHDFSPVGKDRTRSQEPFAAIITCADSRISPSLIFDVQQGNLFVSRVAGNTLDTGTLGSTEYAVAVLGVKVIMVLGHTNCGAVTAAIGVANGTSSYPPAKYGAIGAFVDAVVPAVKEVPPESRDLSTCTITNVQRQVALLAATDPIVKPAVQAGTVAVVGGLYEIGSGRVRLV